MEDFAAALESYTLETEPAPSEDNVFKGTVIKITPTHVVVDIGFKSEGLVPIAEVTDAQGNIKFQPGDQIEVMVQRGENEEGAVLLSHERAQRVRKRDVFAKYGPQARAVLEALLAKYQDDGVINLDDTRVLRIPPFDAMGTPIELIRRFGTRADFERAVHELQAALYKEVA